MTTGRAALACHQSHVHNPNKSLCRPQSSSASRVTAAASGFLNLSQSFVLPDRYCDPSRFDTMPSSPSLQAWHTASPSASLIKVLYCFHQNKADSKCEVVHTSLPIRSPQSALASLVCWQEGTHARASRYRYCCNSLDRVRLEADFLLGSACWSGRTPSRDCAYGYFPDAPES